MSMLYCIIYLTVSYLVYCKAHVSIEHDGHDWIIRELGNKYKNTTLNYLETFLHHCEPFQQKQNGLKQELVVKPIISSDFNFLPISSWFDKYPFLSWWKI